MSDCHCCTCKPQTTPCDVASDLRAQIAAVERERDEARTIRDHNDTLYRGQWERAEEAYQKLAAAEARVAEERERCARITDDQAQKTGNGHARSVAGEIGRLIRSGAAALRAPDGEGAP